MRSWGFGIAGIVCVFAGGFGSGRLTADTSPPPPPDPCGAYVTLAIEHANDCLDRWTATVDAFHDTVTQSTTVTTASAAKVRKNWDRYRRNLCRK